MKKAHTYSQRENERELKQKCIVESAYIICHQLILITNKWTISFNDNCYENNNFKDFPFQMCISIIWTV